MEIRGVFSLEQLRDLGYSNKLLERSLAEGNLRRIDRGWFATAGADMRIVTAVQAHCHLGCLSGCAFYDIWVPEHCGLHIVHGVGVVPIKKSSYQVHRYSQPQPNSAVWPLEDCLEQVVRHHDIETCLIVLESAIYKGRISKYMAIEILENCRGSIPTKKLQRLHKYLVYAESGSETRVRLFLQMRRIPVRIQVKISGMEGRVDLVVGDRLVIECDSHKHHSTPEDQLRDRKRDLALRALGYENIRLAYPQIWGLEWEETMQHILNEVRKRRHILRK